MTFFFPHRLPFDKGPAPPLCQSPKLPPPLPLPPPGGQRNPKFPETSSTRDNSPTQPSFLSAPTFPSPSSQFKNFPPPFLDIFYSRTSLDLHCFCFLLFSSIALCFLCGCRGFFFPHLFTFHTLPPFPLPPPPLLHSTPQPHFSPSLLLFLSSRIAPAENKPQVFPHFFPFSPPFFPPLASPPTRPSKPPPWLFLFPVQGFSPLQARPTRPPKKKLQGQQSHGPPLLTQPRPSWYPRSLLQAIVMYSFLRILNFFLNPFVTQPFFPFPNIPRSTPPFEVLQVPPFYFQTQIRTLFNSPPK